MMQTLRLSLKRVDMEKTMITLGMALMEITGAVLFICGLFDIRIV